MSRVNLIFLLCKKEHEINPVLQLVEKGPVRIITRQGAKLKRDKMYEVAVEEGTKRFLVFHVASFLRFMAANLSLTQLETWARPR